MSVSNPPETTEAMLNGHTGAMNYYIRWLTSQIIHMKWVESDLPGSNNSGRSYGSWSEPKIQISRVPLVRKEKSNSSGSNSSGGIETENHLSRVPPAPKEKRSGSTNSGSSYDSGIEIKDHSSRAPPVRKDKRGGGSNNSGSSYDSGIEVKDNSSGAVPARKDNLRNVVGSNRPSKTTLDNTVRVSESNPVHPDKYSLHELSSRTMTESGFTTSPTSHSIKIARVGSVLTPPQSRKQPHDSSYISGKSIPDTAPTPSLHTNLPTTATSLDPNGTCIRESEDALDRPRHYGSDTTLALSKKSSIASLAAMTYSMDRPPIYARETGSDSYTSSSADLEFDCGQLEMVLISKRLEIARHLVLLYLERERFHPGDKLSGARTYNGVYGPRSSSRSNRDTSPDGNKATPQVLGKRLRECNGEDQDENRRSRRGPTSDGSPDSTEDLQLWACPFYKQNRRRHQPCGRAVLKTISRVKYHLKRYHQPPIHCDRCSMIFGTEAERVEHNRQMTPCLLQAPTQWNGITESQNKELSRKTSPKQSPKENWYQIYQILFPDGTPPDSPYLEGLESYELRQIVAFADVEGPSIVTSVLAGLPEPHSLQPEELPNYLNSVTQEFVSLLFERWESVGRSVDTSLPTPSPVEQPPINTYGNTPMLISQPSDAQTLQDHIFPQAWSSVPLTPVYEDDFMDWPHSSDNSVISILSATLDLAFFPSILEDSSGPQL